MTTEDDACQEPVSDAQSVGRRRISGATSSGRHEHERPRDRGRLGQH
jgi:hypothetical protein